jgi:hypothetical protein
MRIWHVIFTVESYVCQASKSLSSNMLTCLPKSFPWCYILSFVKVLPYQRIYPTFYHFPANSRSSSIHGHLALARTFWLCSEVLYQIQYLLLQILLYVNISYFMGSQKIGKYYGNKEILRGFCTVGSLHYLK